MLLPTSSGYPGCRQLKQTVVMRGSFSYLRTSTNCIKQHESKLSHVDILQLFDLKHHGNGWNLSGESLQLHITGCGS